jgi:putative ABC transport system permease protein
MWPPFSSSPSSPEIGSSVLVGYPAMENYLGFDGHASAIYLRAATSRVQAVGNLLAAQANPEIRARSTSSSPQPPSPPRERSARCSWASAR